jgi:catechol 2,3-dioxygenase-like lactoylglutathione lyase family enzyme
MKPGYIQTIIVLCLFLMSCASEEIAEISQGDSLIGEVAQISLSCVDLEKSLGFYQKLNFSVLEARLDAQTPWAMISDGSQLFMLSQYEFPSPALTFYGKSLPDRIKQLQLSGLVLETIRNDKDQVKSAILKNPMNLGITLIDFDPNKLLKPVRKTDFVLEKFANIKIPVSDLTDALKFWEKVGFTGITKKDIDPPWALLEQAGLQLHLLPDTSLVQATLCYTGLNEEKLLGILKEVEIEFEKVQLLQRSWLFFESPDKQLFMIELEADQTQE